MKKLFSILGTILALSAFFAVKLYHHHHFGSSLLQRMLVHCGTDQECADHVEARFQSCRDEQNFSRSSQDEEDTKSFMECFASDLAEFHTR